MWTFSKNQTTSNFLKAVFLGYSSSMFQLFFTPIRDIRQKLETVLEIVWAIYLHARSRKPQNVGILLSL